MDFLVARDDLRRHRTDPSPLDDLGASPVGAEAAADVIDDGQVLVRVDRFGFTANNITYGAFGDMMGYWRFFPAPDGWGRIPVWGYGDIEASRVEGLEVGDRVFGYLPMSERVVLTPTDVSAHGFVDGAAHRAALPVVYNQYERVPVPEDEAAQLAEHHQCLLRPLFMTSFLIDDWLDDNAFFGATTVVLASASSKTSLGLAHLLSSRDGITVVGLTSPRNRELVERVGYYDRTVLYGELAAEPSDEPTVFVDMAGDGSVALEVHRHYAGNLRYSCMVGATHWEQGARTEDLPGPAPTLFFAPDQLVKRRADWGPGGIEERLGAAWSTFVTSVDGWLTVVERHGPDAVALTYTEVLEGQAPPDEGFVLSL